ncbi:putative membrane protein, partial [Vibrio parahaemolyticus VPTS-2010_2]
ALAV